MTTMTMTMVMMMAMLTLSLKKRLAKLTKVTAAVEKNCADGVEHDGQHGSGALPNDEGC